MVPSTLCITLFCAVGIVLLGLCPPSLPAADFEAQAGKEYPLGIIGQVEDGLITPGGFRFEARVDSGATTCSIDARDIKPFERDGEKWVRFTLVGRGDQDGISKTIERKVSRIAKIRQHGENLERYAVQLGIRMGETDMAHEFTLANREKFNFPLLLGRNLLDDNALIDTARTKNLTLVVPEGALATAKAEEPQGAKAE